MRRIRKEQLDALSRLVANSAERAISITELAEQLSVSFATARRRLEALASQRGLSVLEGPPRSGKRGPKSTTWYLGKRGSAPTPELVSAPAPRPPAPARPTLPPLTLPAPVLAALTADEQRALQLLFHVTAARTSDLARDLDKSPARVDGLMRGLIRKLHAAGTPLYDDENLPDGETLYRLLAEVKP